MGVHENISHDKMPEQGSFLGKRVRVTFNYDASRSIGGRVVRDDREEPGLTIIALDDERVILATECQYTLV